MRNALLKLLAILLMASVILPVASRVSAVQVGHLDAALVSEVSSIQPGQPFWVALNLEMEKDWHVYWRNPGDAGLPTKIVWDSLPPGFTASDIHWPYPSIFKLGDLANFGYHGEVLLPVMITPPEALEPGSTLTLKAHASWLLCKEECIPGEVELSLSLPVMDEPPKYKDFWFDRFNQTRNLFPLDSTQWKVSAAISDKWIMLKLKPPDWFEGTLDSVVLYPYDNGIIANAAPQLLSKVPDGHMLKVGRAKFSDEPPERLRGILVSEMGWRGPGSEHAFEFDITVRQNGELITDTGIASIWHALLFAFLGGIILNLMPCVLPVLSLKVLSFVKQAEQGRGAAFTHGLVFTAGVLVSFWALVGLLLLLRAGGEELGWGFQLQSPSFLVVLSAFMFLFGLNLMGVFEVGMSLTGFGAQKASGGGWFGSFLNGITATVVATPCTAPFMGSALGYSLTQPTWVVWLIFTCLALGMAAPYLVLSSSPALLRFVPRPGRWMESLKQFMGFLLMATVVWLCWVLGAQAGVNAVAILLLTLVLLGLGAWVYGRWGGLAARGATRTVAYTFTLVLILGGLGVGLASVNTFSTGTLGSGAHAQGEIHWQPFAPEAVETALNEGKPVFIDFTAAWCLTCQVNERVAFSSDDVQARFTELNIVPLKADWTSRNETITRALAEHGRNSVPLYVIYDSKKPNNPIILPEILTPGIVLQALESIGSAN